MEILLLIACGFLWAILVGVRNCLAELKKITERLDVSNGLTSVSFDRNDVLKISMDEQSRKLSNIEEVTLYFYEAARKARGY